jgi:hypothetical protein
MNAQHRRRLIVGIVAVAPGIAAAVIVWMPRDHAAPAIAGMVRRTEIRIAPEIAGRLASIEVQAGQTVRKSVTGSGTPLSSCAPLSSTMKSPATCPLDCRGDQNGSGFGRSLNSRGNVGCFPEHLAGGVDDDGAALKSDALDQFGNASAGVVRVEFCKAALDGQGGAHSSLGVVFLGFRVAKWG